jgi:hypothetical protein
MKMHGAEHVNHSPSMNLLPFMKPKGLVLCSNEPATGPCREQNDFRLHCPTLFL